MASSPAYLRLAGPLAFSLVPSAPALPSPYRCFQKQTQPRRAAIKVAAAATSRRSAGSGGGDEAALRAAAALAADTFLQSDVNIGIGNGLGVSVHQLSGSPVTFW